MPAQADDPLSRALRALAHAQGAALPLDAVDALSEMSDALLEAPEERKTFVIVANAAMTLIEVLDDYEEAVKSGDEGKIAAAAEAGDEAEDGLVDALNELHAFVASTDDATGDAAYLAALDQSNDDEATRR